MSARRLPLIWVVLWAGGLAGCARCPEKFVSLQALVEEYNANAWRVPKLWARARIRASFQGFSWGSVSPLAPANGYVMLWKLPGSAGTSEKVDFVLIGKEIAELFRAGVDAQRGLYYFWYNVGQEGGAWFGREELAGAPRVAHIPFDPTQLVEILGVTQLPPPAPEVLPAVVMTLQQDPCAYVVRYVRPQPETGFLKIWREVYFRWSDTEPRQPFRVKLYGPDGLCRVVAEVGRYQRVVWEGPPEQAPLMPTDVRMTWPEIKDVQPASAIHVRLSEMSTVHPFGSEIFDFPAPGNPPSGVGELIQVDAAYGRVEAERIGR